MLQTPDKLTPRFGDSPKTRRALILTLWAVLTFCVVIGSLSSSGCAVVAAIGRLHVNDKVMGFCAYLALALLPVIGFQDRRSGLKAGLSRFLLGVLIGGWPAFLSRSRRRTRGSRCHRRGRQLRCPAGAPNPYA